MMSIGLVHLEQRLQRLERLLYKVATHVGCLDEERAEVGPPDGFARLLQKERSALDLRVAKLEIKAVHFASRLAHYMRERWARDNMLRRSTDAMADGIETFEERLNNVELAAFPAAADIVSEVIGEAPRSADAKTEALDRRIPKTRRS
jgi:hypothetical protein